MTEVWTQWEGQVINGVYPLRRFLNSSDHSSVFLTETRTEGFLNAAIKIIPADPALTEVQLWHWKTAATFLHPHLIRLLDWGQCQLDGRPFLFVVMEYAEETLSQTLPYRALEPDEVREMLVPTLDALAFLHRENWVQGQIKPSNFLVVDDQLKLAIDTIRPIGVARSNIGQLSPYDPPEAEKGEVLAAGDIWALGVTIVEALTQYPPTWLHGRSEPPSLPANLPPAFAEIVRRCFSRDPSDRPTIAELQAEMKRPGPASAKPAPQPTALEQSRPTAPVRNWVPEPAPQQAEWDLNPPKRAWVMPSIVAVGVILVALWGGSHLLKRHPKAPEPVVPATSAAPEQAAPPPPAAPAPPPPETPAPASVKSATDQPPPARPAIRPTVQHPQLPAEGSSSVTHEEIPNVPRSARETIHGHVKVVVRVTVNSSGSVVSETLENPGPSQYFNRLATQAARKWKFAPTGSPGSREWLLRFDFGREGTTARATGPR